MRDKIRNKIKRQGNNIVITDIAEWDIGWNGDHCKLYICLTVEDRYLEIGECIVVFESYDEYNPYGKCIERFEEITGFSWKAYKESTYKHNDEENRWNIFLKEAMKTNER